MGIFSNLFRKKQNTHQPDEYRAVIACNQEFEALLSADKYIARSDYKSLVERYESVYTFFSTTQRANTLAYYCKKNKLSEAEIQKFLLFYEDICDLKKGSTIFQEHNDSFVQDHIRSEKAYLDAILHAVDPAIMLDEEQRKAVLSDEDHTLIIAGAGAGKTTTIAAKVRYLVEKRHIDPSQILVISFTNKAVNELRERINTRLSIPCPITTFHSAGYAILRKHDDKKKKIVGDGFLFHCVNEYLKEKILTQPDLVDKLVLFFGSYFDAPYEGDDINLFFNYISKADFSTLKSNVNEYIAQTIDRRTHKIITITDEVLRSAQEVQIANFLYLNQIDYVYEEVYPYHILKAKKPYTPDFCIRQEDKIAYIEHFGITESGEHNFYSAGELERYKREIQDKIALHKKHGSILIYTYSRYDDGRDLLEHLREQLEANGFVLNRRPAKEVFIKLVNAEENKYILKLVKLLCRFIINFKTNGHTHEEYFRFQRMNANVRTKLFLDVCEACYLEYQKRLSEEGAIDFEDMINNSARLIRESQISGEQLDFKYIIVDEYQDISRQRFDLVKELSKMCSGKIIAVGDDWQSIYAFSGSDISLFTHFCSIMGYGQELKITRTYRNAQEVIDIAGNFVQKNGAQIRKSLISPRHIQTPVVIQTYQEEFPKEEFQGKGGKYYHLGKQVEKVIGTILEQNRAEGRSLNSTILLIGRFHFDARNLCYSRDFVYDERSGKIFSKKYPKAKLEFLTAHSSKGLGYDNVVIINARNEIYGFPSKIDDDPVLRYVVREDVSMEYAEERRLFYVAMTRTKNRVYIITPGEHPSEFVLELLRDHPDITLNGGLNRESTTSVGIMKKCPICGYPLQLRYKKNYGLRLWMCSNEPEICNYITNEIAGGELTIQKCDKCRDGYLIVKRVKKDGSYILGCTNYADDGTGCDRLMNLEFYKRWLKTGFEDDLSYDKPSYCTESPERVPQATPPRAVSPVERKKAEVHQTAHRSFPIGRDVFEIVVDDTGGEITDTELLAVLRALRFEIAKEKGLSPRKVLNDRLLVGLATYRPETHEDYISIYGMGEANYDAYGIRFIEAIKKFYENK